jgi:phenylacetate-CoA ligase
MREWTLQLYHHLPAPARDLAASLRGLRLRSWRYGADSEQLVAEAFERECWSGAQWKSWQEERLAYVLHRAATRVPYYRELWRARRLRGDRTSWEEVANWPVLEKEALRARPLEFVADDCNPRRMFHEHTSGTTGKSLDLWVSRNTVREWYALFEARCRLWYGVSRNDRWAILGGQVVTPVMNRKPPFWVWNAALKQLYMSSYHLAPDLVPYYLEELTAKRVKYLLGYTSALYELAQEALRQGGRGLQMKVVITNAEPVFDYQRRVIEEAFQCPVRETYGMAEIVTAASECEAGTLHLWPEVGWTEVLENERAIAKGVSGELVTTGLLNVDMPLIRYRVGDRGILPSNDTSCACGRRLPVLASVDGRSDDTLYTADGRRIGRLDPVFKSKLPIVEAQIIQETLNHVRVRFIPAADYDEQAGASIVKRLRDRMGDVRVTLEQVERLPRTANGKFRAVICNLPAAEHIAVEGARSQ